MMQLKRISVSPALTYYRLCKLYIVSQKHFTTRSTLAVVEVIFSYSEVKQVIIKILQTYLKLFHFKKCLFLTSV